MDWRFHYMDQIIMAAISSGAGHERWTGRRAAGIVTFTSKFEQT